MAKRSFGIFPAQINFRSLHRKMISDIHFTVYVHIDGEFIAKHIVVWFERSRIFVFHKLILHVTYMCVYDKYATSVEIKAQKYTEWGKLCNEPFNRLILSNNFSTLNGLT